MKSPKEHLVRWVITAAVLAMAAACGSQPARVAGSSQAQTELVPLPGGSARPAYPLDAYVLTRDQIGVIERARLIVAHRCLASLGFGKAELAAVVTPPKEEDHKVVEFLDPELAAEHGYGGIEIPARGPTSAQGRCFAEGDRQVKAGAGPLGLDPRTLLAKATFAVWQDSRYKAAEKQWSSCMKGKGYTFQTHVSAQLDPRWDKRPADQAASAEERKVAVQDALCRRQVNLVGIAQAIEVMHQKKLVNDNHARLLEGKRVADAWLKNAESIIAKG